MIKGSDISIFKKGLLIIGIPLLFELLLVGILSFLVSQSSKDVAQAQWRQDQGSAVDNVFRCSFNAFTAVIAYGVDETEENAQHYDNAIKSVAPARKFLKELCASDKDSSERVAHADDFLNGNLRMIESIKTELDQGEKALHSMSFLERQAYLLKMVRQLKNLQHDMNDPNLEMEAIAHRAHERDRILVFFVLILGLAGNVIVALKVSNFFSRNVSDRLKVIADNGRLLAKKQELEPPQDGRDEVALLDHTFHTMTTALAASAAKQREIMDNSADVICSLSENGEFMLLNQSSERRWGYKPSELIDSLLNELLSSESASQISEYFAKLRSSTNARPVSVQMRNKSGALIDTSWSCHWSELDQCFFCVVHDISDQREAERIKERFVNVMGKHLRFPLESIQGNLQDLSESMPGVLNDRGVKLVKSCTLSSGRIIQLVDELMDLEKMEQGGPQLQLNEVQVSEIISSSFASLQSFADQNQIKLVSNAIDLTFKGDSNRLTQVLVNILSNAVKYSPPGGTVTVSAEKIGKNLTFAVSDEGPGIPPEALSSLFARFKRLDRAIDKTVTGTGLGLSICKMIVEAHGGEIGAGNNPGRGSRFWFSVPLSD